jgi:hypothetical protein
MGVFEMVVSLVFIGTLGKVAKEYFRSGRRGPAAAEEQRIQVLETELRSAEERLALTEDRVSDLTEKLVFLERLLAEPEGRGRIDPPRG